MANYTDGAGLAVKPSSADALIPNFVLTPFNYEQSSIGFVFEDGVPEEAVQALSRAVQEKVEEDLPIGLSPETMDMLMHLAYETLMHWAQCQYLCRDLRGGWTYETP